MKPTLDSNNLVAYSRAGDVFHYRWAARRCLKLIQPNSNLESVFIEGSNERKKAGEYVIDVSEYYKETGNRSRIEYFQLKHTTVRQDKPFTLGSLKNTIVGFSDRYKQHSKERTLSGVSFAIITNRKIDETLKKNISTISQGGDKINKRFIQILKNYTTLKGKKLMQFCSLLKFADSEGDYRDQEEDLKIEMSKLQPGIVDSTQVDSIVSLVQRKVLPESYGKITKEDILRPFGMTSLDQLFPAPPLFEKTNNITDREQYRRILDGIIDADQPLIIQAAGGVGKTVFSQYVLHMLPEGPLGIAYDCFGSGKYRSRSKPRHRHRDALVQIANELAALGLCDSMLIKDTTQESDIVRDFLNRIELSIKSLKQITENAKLYILIDAADNAEMAAEELGDTCFAHEILKEEISKDCKLIFLCRPERTHLLKPAASTPLLNLDPFSKEETFENLKKWFPQATQSQSYEFHRLTSGNPRVQMNVISSGHSSIDELLEFLGPFGISVEQQIESQLNAAVQKIKDVLSEDYQIRVDRICTGLASLPPNIPLEVLSMTSDVKVEDVKSFVADIGRALWLLDSSVQFRDEPTEKWFRDSYLGSQEDFSRYIDVLEPLANDFTYVAEILPQLYLQAGQYDHLIKIALSDKLLPVNNPIDTRNVLIYRLQFAFKAALRSENYRDAIQLALRAGEEVAGDQRQQDLFQNNIDLIPKLQDNLKVQEIAFKKILRSKWEGSENAYTASLLSEIEEYRGEAQGYLRSAMNWLHIYFEDSKEKNDRSQEGSVSDDDILELAYTHLNLNGVRSCLEFLNNIKPWEFIFRVVKRLVNRLIDAERFDEINQLLEHARGNKFHVVAIVSEMVEVGRFAEADDIENCLQILSDSAKRIRKPKDPLHDTVTPSVVAFLEVCLHRNMKDGLIIQALDYYVPKIASQGAGSRHISKERITFLKALSIRCVLSKNSTIHLDDLMPEVYKSEDGNRNYSEDIKEFNEVIGGLFPWYLLRAQLISGGVFDLVEMAKQAKKDSKSAYGGRYRTYDILPHEIADVSSSILVYCNEYKSEVILQYFNNYLQNNSSFTIPQRIHLLRAGIRANHLKGVLSEIENSTYKLINGQKEARPEDIADDYISIARAVLSGSKDDATVYFEDAINIVSKFGDEIVERWEAIESLGERSASNSSDDLAYKFVRCAELVGKYVYKEKHWNRSGALVTCTKMSPQIGISALSRWRDREIGRFEYQLEDVLSFLVKSKVIKPAVAWSMARFFSSHHLIEFLSACLTNEHSDKIKSDIFNDAFELTRKDGAAPDYWDQMKSIADQYQISNVGLDYVVDFYKGQAKNPKPPKIKQQKRTKDEEKKWKRVFHNLEILNPAGLSTMIDRFSSEFDKSDDRLFRRPSDLYVEALSRIEANELYNFIDLLFGSEKVSHYDFGRVLSSIPEDWKNKVSFKKKWPEIINRLGMRYAHELINPYSYRSAVQKLGIDDDLAKDLRKGIFQGLSQGQEFTNASTLFSFVRHASTFIDSSQAVDLVDYALSRFELHVDDDFGDGSWDKWLHVSSDPNTNIAGFIWSALGSPRSETRWKACHTIKKLAEFDCTMVLSSLVEWLEHNKVDAFGSKQFPFYCLHARQYLFIALYRVSIDFPEILVSYKEIFRKYSQDEPHILIQILASKIALNIEKAISGTYSCVEVSSLKAVGKSKHGARKEKYGYRVDSYFHQIGKVDTKVEYNFAYDFDCYWFEPLGDVFGVSSKQIEELCANVVINEWKHDKVPGYNNDPRLNLWNNSSDRQTWYNKSDYPKTDNFDFYISYHSMLVVAAKLIESMPVISSRDYWDEEDAWDYWLARHFLTRVDGKWLSDSRGELPLERPDWITEEIEDELWRTDIKEQDFLKSLKIQHGEETWFTVKGGWTERHNSKYETYSISTALVSKETSGALLRALETCSNCHDYKLPDYQEERVEIESDIFKLNGFIDNSDSSKGLDEFDAYAANLTYPPFSLGESYIRDLGLKSHNDGKTLCLSNGQVALKCDTWSGNIYGYDEEPEQSGMRLSASLSLLQRLCKKYDSNLIIDVNISRDIAYKYRQEDHEYLAPSHKIYILTKDGRLKSTGQSISLR